MYGVVLMMALSGAGEAPQCWFHRCCGCSGSYGCSCYGGYGCSGYGCSGYGCSGYGCSGYGGHGWRHGCQGCYGGYGCYGSCYGCAGTGVYGYYGPVVDAPMAPPGPPPATPPMPPPPPPPGKTSVPLPSETYFRTPATIQVSVPAEAVLYFDGMKMTSSSASRRFSTPPLETGKSYFYNVKAEVVRAGQTVTTTQRVVVRAGEQAQVQIDFAPTGNLVARQN